jgi:SAM-dependent methyltransferase
MGRLAQMRTRLAARMQAGARRLPVSEYSGFDRGEPIDRHYIAEFLGRFACLPGYSEGDIKGHVLEVGGREYADRFGVAADAPGPGVVHRVDVLHESAVNPQATLVGDLQDPSTLPAATFDCVICTQVLPFVWDTRAVLANIHASLRPGGVLLATTPGITRAGVRERDQWGDFWRFTSGSLRRLAAEAFPGGTIEVEGHGNLQAATFFLYGFAAHELAPDALRMRDPDYEVLIGLRAIKAAAA